MRFSGTPFPAITITIAPPPPPDPERERSIFFVVTGTHYRTKTPPDQQPTNSCRGYDKKGGYLQDIFSSMVSRVRCLVQCMTWWALLLFVLAVGGVSHWVGRVVHGEKLGVTTTFCSSGSLIALLCSW